MKFKTIRSASLRNEMHFQMHSDIIDAAADCDIEAMKIDMPYQSYKASHGREDEAFKKIVKSPLTKRAQETDKLRDEACRGLTAAIKAASKRSVPGIAEKAREVDIVVKNYGNLTKKPLNAETALITNMVQDLEGPKYGPSVDAIGVRPWVTDLKEHNEAFKALAKDRYNEAADKCAIAMKDARAEVDDAYKMFLKHIDVLADTHGKAAYERFETKHNLIITKYKSAIGHSKGAAIAGEPEELDEEEGM